jgi:ABC-type multidrug transport system permease subunit
MVRLRRALTVLRARNREFVRDRSALAWNIIFPVLVVLGFAFAFSGEPADLYKVGVYGNDRSHPFFQTRHIQFTPVASIDLAITKVQRHQLDMAIDTGTMRFWINKDAPKGYVVRQLLAASGHGVPWREETVEGRAIRYVDWLLPGMLALNMMFSALWGVGYVIVRYRRAGVLKRLRATPLTALEFVVAQIVSRLVIILSISAFVLFSISLLVDFAMYGSWLNLLIVYAVGALSLVSLGLLVASRTASQELADGLLNFISWPMMFLSGVWFSLEGLHPVFQKLALVFPLTHLINAARAIMIDGATLAQVGGSLAVMLGISVLFIAISAVLFRWE